MRAFRSLSTVIGLAILAILVALIGKDQTLAATARALGWQSLLVCLPFVLIMAVDTLGWRYAFAYDRVPFLRLMAARVAGEAVNVMTAVAPVGGDAIKVWFLRPHVPYRESVASVIIAKTTITLSQTLFLLLGVAVALALSVDARLVAAMLWLLLAELVGAGGFLLVQVTGLLGRQKAELSLAGVPAPLLDGLLNPREQTEARVREKDLALREAHVDPVELAPREEVDYRLGVPRILECPREEVAEAAGHRQEWDREPHGRRGRLAERRVAPDRDEVREGGAARPRPTDELVELAERQDTDGVTLGSERPPRLSRDGHRATVARARGHDDLHRRVHGLPLPVMLTSRTSCCSAECGNRRPRDSPNFGSIDRATAAKVAGKCQCLRVPSPNRAFARWSRR